MITYRYIPYNPDDDKQISTETLMSILSEMMMRYNTSLEESLKELISRGLPVNLFLREGKMTDLTGDLEKKINDAIQKILNEYDFSTQREIFKKEIDSLFKDIEKYDTKFSESFLSEIKKAMQNKNLDSLFRLKWELSKSDDHPHLKKVTDKLIPIFEDYDKVMTGASKFDFRGKTIPAREEAKNIIEELEQLNALQIALREMIESGDIFNINLENIAKYLGLESYKEFIEKRDSILENLKKLLRSEKRIIENEKGEAELSPDSIRKIGRKALKEVFSNMKNDSSGRHSLQSFGDSEMKSHTQKNTSLVTI